MPETPLPPDASVVQNIAIRADAKDEGKLREFIRKLAHQFNQRAAHVREVISPQGGEGNTQELIADLEKLAAAMKQCESKTQEVPADVQVGFVRAVEKDPVYLRQYNDGALAVTNSQDWQMSNGISRIGIAIAHAIPQGSISPEVVAQLQKVFMEPVEVTFGDMPKPEIGQSFLTFQNQWKTERVDKELDEIYDVQGTSERDDEVSKRSITH